MVPVNLKSLIGKLNETCHRTLEGAAGLCLSRMNYNVEIEHWLMKLLEESNTDIELILKHFGVDVSRLTTDLTSVLDRLKTGNSRSPALSPNVVDLARQAWLFASVELSAQQTRSGHLLTALLSDESLSLLARDASDEFEKISSEALNGNLAAIIADSSESAGEAAEQAPSGGPGQPVKPGVASKTPALDQYTTDLTARAKAGKIDPVLGRDAEIRQVIDILTRRRQNNPIMTGEAGVGKTAVVEGFALRVASGDVPNVLQNVGIRGLDLGLLQAGAGIKGEFEKRLKSVINEIKSSPTPIILFIDEAHTMIGAGGQAGQSDAANLLKPPLARGELRTIAATTWAEYKKYFEKDAALARRFQVVKVEEPSEEVCIQMLQGLAGTLQSHHKVRILNEAIEDAVRLSHRYISGRQLPDKAVSLLDTACARVRLEQSSTPAAVEDARHLIRKLNTAIRILQREANTGADNGEQLAALEEEKKDTQAQLDSLEDRWNSERELVDKIRSILDELQPPDTAEKLEKAKGAEISDSGAPKSDSTDEKKEDSHPDPLSKGEEETAAEPLTDEQREELRGELATLNAQLDEVQGERPLIQVSVDSQAVADIVSSWTGIPVGRMVSDQIKTVIQLKDRMEERIIGQSHALDQISEAISTSRAKLTDPRRPIGVFMLAGPSGTGKTETAIVLSELLYGGEQNMTVINMSEFKEEHKVSLLMGSPPGYVGYGEGGVLTEAVRRKPYSIVLLDELEKAHEGVQEIFYQVFDKGNMRDGEGRDINFKNTVIIATTNAGTDLVAKLCSDPDTAPEPSALTEALHKELLKSFKPAFLGRVNIIPYYPLGDEVLKKIVALKLGSISRRIQDSYGAEFSYDNDVLDSVADRCTEVESGARNIDHILNQTMLPEMSAEFLSRMADQKEISNVQVAVGGDGNFQYWIT